MRDRAADPFLPADGLRGLRNSWRAHRPWRGAGGNCDGGRNVNEPRMVEVRRKVLRENDLLARRLRERFQRAGVQVISLVSSPGSGKTALLERLLTDLGRVYQVAALVGDLATDNDAARLARSGVPVKQI